MDEQNPRAKDYAHHNQSFQELLPERAQTATLQSCRDCCALWQTLKHMNAGESSPLKATLISLRVSAEMLPFLWFYLWARNSASTLRSCRHPSERLPTPSVRLQVELIKAPGSTSKIFQRLSTSLLADTNDWCSKHPRPSFHPYLSLRGFPSPLTPVRIYDPDVLERQNPTILCSTVLQRGSRSNCRCQARQL